MSYDFSAIEEKWQQYWKEQGFHRQTKSPDKEKFYALTMFPYPSGDLHIGHWYAMVPSDTRARYKRMRGYNVLFPMGFDAFGLPAENAAIKHNIHPYNWTIENIKRMRGQLRSMGAMFDWEREIITCDPEYYKWNQWLFIKLYEHGLAYKKNSPVDWCPTCNTTLAREQVVGEEKLCERCDTPVTKRELNQWFLKITDYAEELLDFSELNWPERIKVMQTNWIGRSEGVEFGIEIKGTGDKIAVFTTRIDTVFGVSFVVLAPEHPLVPKITSDQQKDVVTDYIAKSARQTEIERLSTKTEKDGVFTGAWAIHPFTGAELPIYIADYVLLSYGTGSVMAVPGHDQRDYDFAKRYNLPIPTVIKPFDGEPPAGEAYTGPGVLINSGEYTGLDNKVAAERLTHFLETQGLGGVKINYRLRDWLVSRQRYWGTPIPFVNCEHCGLVPVPESELPVLLPEDAEFRPTGESPLRFNENFLKTSCPQCNQPAERETDTMDTFFDSSWYQYRYVSPKEKTALFNQSDAEYWLPVDQYTGGVEHATMHLLYTRFFTKAMRDMGLLNFSEPMRSLFNQGIILGEDSEKMSKSRGNVVAPDDLVAEHGADTVRAYLMFMAPWELGGPWNSEGIGGISRFLNKVWRLAMGEQISTQKPQQTTEEELNRLINSTIKRVTEDMENFKFNTMLSALMEYTNQLVRWQGSKLATSPLWQQGIETLILLLAPVAPHLCEELWQQTGHQNSVHLQKWPVYDPNALVKNTIEIPVQVNGKLRGTITISPDINQEQAVEIAQKNSKINSHLQQKTIVKIIYVPKKLLNLVVK
ncbi:MAG: leucine--tRNA ligase [Firmicutes bacterium]|nr:leucine--tRNA ligase [Bacillota bacterium]